MPLTVDELCARYRNENVHTEHVAALALRLFDATHAALGLPASDRPLLEAACRLHDVGYSVDADRHPQVSREIVQREGLTGFDDEQRALIADIIPLHAGKIIGGSKRARQLGAFLRLADGLDYSHAQDAHIMNVKRGIVTVRCDAFPHNRIRAGLKADLWRATFPVGIRFVAPANERLRWPTSLRRQLWIQWKTMLINVEDAIAGKSAEPLHDFRVALRRARALLRMLSNRNKPIERGLARIGDALSAARDADVWIEFLQRHRVTGKFMRRELAWRESRQRAVPATLRGTRFATLRQRMNRFLRVELADAGIPRGALAKELRRVRRLARLRHSDSADELHDLRIALRRARYVAEFTGHAALVRRLRCCERPLGRVHDVDTAMTRPGLPDELASLLRRQRRKHLKELRSAWPGLKKWLQ